MAYSAYGLTVDSDLALHLPRVERPADIVVARLDIPVDHRMVRWFDNTSSDWCQAGLVGDDFCLRFGDEAEFVVAADGRRLGWYSIEAPSSTLVHLLLDHVLPRALTKFGRAVLHGSCLSLARGSCFAIIGDSGQGKSTLAAGLVGQGYRFLADDCVVVDVEAALPRVAPAYPELRLSPASVDIAGVTGLVDVGDVTRTGSKRRMALGDVGDRPDERPVLRVVFELDPICDSTILTAGEPVSPGVAAVKLLSHSFHLNADDQRRGALDRCAVIAEACEVRRLPYEHSAAGLSAALETVGNVVTRASGG